MAVWMQCGSCVTPPPADGTVPPDKARSSLPDQVRSQAAVILAGIVLHYPRETTPCQPS